MKNSIKNEKYVILYFVTKVLLCASLAQISQQNLVHAQTNLNCTQKAGFNSTKPAIGDRFAENKKFFDTDKNLIDKYNVILYTKFGKVEITKYDIKKFLKQNKRGSI